MCHPCPKHSNYGFLEMSSSALAFTLALFPTVSDGNFFNNLASMSNFPRLHLFKQCGTRAVC